MRLDGPGKPPSIPSDSFERVEVTKLKVQPVQQHDASAELDSESAESKSGRLGKILDIVQRAQEKKKEHDQNNKKNRKALAASAYKRAAIIEVTEHMGQQLDIKF